MRDRIVTFVDEPVTQKILETAISKGHLEHFDDKIHVFPDILSEAVQIRKQLKLVTGKMQEAKIRYKWITPGKLRITYVLLMKKVV